MIELLAVPVLMALVVRAVYLVIEIKRIDAETLPPIERNISPEWFEAAKELDAIDRRTGLNKTNGWEPLYRSKGASLRKKMHDQGWRELPETVTTKTGSGSTCIQSKSVITDDMATEIKRQWSERPIRIKNMAGMVVGEVPNTPMMEERVA